jgi:hypothetical protein
MQLIIKPSPATDDKLKFAGRFFALKEQESRR